MGVVRRRRCRRSMSEEVGADRNDSKERPPGHSSQGVLSKMALYAREICFVVFVAITTYAAVQKSPLKVRKTPLPSPFFPVASIVADFYQGQLSSAFEHISESDFSFVMYYATWDAECEAVRWEFEKVSKFYHTQVYFAAINCWHPDSDCRLTHKIPAYPVLMLYQQHFKGVHYKGLKEFSHMMSFLRDVLQPFMRVEKPADLASLRAKHDAVVVGYLEFQGIRTAPGYHTFYMASMKALEQDSARRVGFAIVTNKKAAKRFGMTLGRTLQLILWNETLTYPVNGSFTSKALVHWVFRHLHQISTWITPPGRKSLGLSDAIQHGPSVLLFTPRNMLRSSQPYYMLFKEVALEYRNCGNNPLLQSLLQSVRHERRAQQSKHKQLSAACQSWMNRKVRLSSQDDLQIHPNGTCCRTVVVQERVQVARVLRMCDLCIVSPPPDEQLCQTLQGEEKRGGLMGHMYQAIHFVQDTCHQLLLKYNPFTRLSLCCHHNRTQAPLSTAAVLPARAPFSASQRPGFHCSRSDDRVLVMAARRQESECKRLREADLLCKYLPVASSMPARSGMQGMSCQANRTLAFVAVDSLVFSEFGQRLGLDVWKEKGHTAVFILDPKAEVHYVMEGEFNKQSLVNFIKNFSVGQLRRFLRSKPDADASERFETPPENKSVAIVSVKEVTTDLFQEVVMDQQKDVLLMYYTSYCGFCISAAHIYLAVSYYLRSLGNITFARIDADNNDLPWEYTVESYPTIIFFPAFRKSESRVFPPELPLTVPNLLHFVLANLNTQSRLQLALQVCDQDCIAQTRGATLQVIHDLLSALRWALSRLGRLQEESQENLLLRKECRDCRQKEALQRRWFFLKALHKRLWMHMHRLRLRLQHLQLVYLRLSTTEDLRVGTRSHEAIVESYESYYGGAKRDLGTERGRIEL